MSSQGQERDDLLRFINQVREQVELTTESELVDEDSAQVAAFGLSCEWIAADDVNLPIDLSAQCRRKLLLGSIEFRERATRERHGRA